MIGEISVKIQKHIFAPQRKATLWEQGMIASSLKKYAGEIGDLIRSKTAKNVLVVTSGNIAGQVIGFLATLIVIRHLSPERFGMLAVAIGVMGLAGQLSDLGISTGFVRYASLYLKENPAKADLLFKSTLYLKLGIALSVMLIGIAASRPLSVYVFNAVELAPLLRLAFIGSLGATLWGYLQAILQASEWFGKYVWVTIFNNTLKLLGILFLLISQLLSEYNALVIMALVPFAGFFLDGLLVPKGWLKTKGRREEQKEIFFDLFHFSKWVTLSTLCTMLTMRLDIFMLQSLTNSKEVGIYSSANQLAMIFPLVTTSLTTALVPKVSNYKTKEELISYIVNILRLIPAVMLMFGVLFAISPLFIPAILGRNYVGSIPMFQVLLVGFALSIILNPISLIFLSLNKPVILSLLNFIQLFLLIPLNLIFITDYGALGASWASLSIRVFALLYLIFMVNKYIKALPSNKTAHLEHAHSQIK